MRRSSIVVAGVCCGWLLVGAVPAWSGLPSPVFSSIGGGPNHHLNISAFIGGSYADTLSPGTTLTISVRDIANLPVPGSFVQLDFTNAYTDFELSSAQNFRGETAALITHGTKIISNHAQADGTVVFAVTGGGLANAPPHAPQSASVFADGVLLGTFSVGSYDRNAIYGADAVDLANWGGDFFNVRNTERSDFNGDGVVTIPDLQNFAVYYFGPPKTSAGPTLVAP